MNNGLARIGWRGIAYVPRIKHAVPVPITPEIPRRKIAIYLNAWLSELSHWTRKAYQEDLVFFVRHWRHTDDVLGSLEELIRGGPAIATEKVLAFRAFLLEHTCARSTVNRRASSIISFLRFCLRAQAITWAVHVRYLKTPRPQNVDGPPPDKIQEVLDCIRGTGLQAKRDRLIILLCFVLMLRRGSVEGLRLEDIDEKQGRISVMLKGRPGERTVKTLPAIVREALRDYLAARMNPKTGPLFVGLRGKVGPGSALSSWQIFRVVRARGEAAGIKGLHPHSLRHSGATALARLSGNVEILRTAGNWSNYNTPARYVSESSGMQLEAARILEGSLKRPDRRTP